MTTTNNQNVKKWDKKELGCLWRKVGKVSQQEFFTGKINLKELGFDKDVSLIIFSNKDRENRQPDYKIYLSEDRPQFAGTPSNSPAKAATTVKKQEAVPTPQDVEIF